MSTQSQQLYENAYPQFERELKFHPLGVDNPKVLTREQVDTYNAQGFLTPINVLSGDEIGEIREYFDWLLPQAIDAGWNSYEITNWHKHCQGVWDIVTNPKILDVVQDLVGDTVILRHSHFFAKLPGDGKRVSWHQDAAYWPITPSKVVSAWLAIDDSHEDNAAMQVIPGSHLSENIPFRESSAEENNVLNQTVPDELLPAVDPVTLRLDAGQMSLHSDWILHGSEVNQSNRRRCGLALRYLSADVRAYDGWNANSVVCRGVEPSGHWENHPRPNGEIIPRKDGDIPMQSHGWRSAYGNAAE